jgi:myo-inositol-1-phosphate synthase
MKKTGVLIVGVNGVNGSTLVTGCALMRKGAVSEEYGITGGRDFDDACLLRVHDVVFGGWDYLQADPLKLAYEYDVIPLSLLDSLDDIPLMEPMSGIRAGLDIPIEKNREAVREPCSAADALDSIKNDICDFRRATGTERIIVLYSGSPSRQVETNITSLTRDEVVKTPVAQLPSGVLYAIGALECGCAFADLTPSQTLEFEAISEVAHESGVPYTGRDLSTGQTFTKLTLANMLKVRNLRLKSWYSTNIIGNHDGKVLSQSEYSTTKIADKTNGLSALLGYADFEHLVKIDYFPPRGDRKEAWDVIDFTGWLGTSMSMRVNWQGQDGALAGSMMLDIVRLLDLALEHGDKGLQSSLGLFFKRPFGTQGRSPDELYMDLLKYVVDRKRD